MRRKSKKRAAFDRSIEPLRREFVERFPWCWRCGRYGTVPHEMCGGPNRQAASGNLACLYAACWLCNGGVLDSPTGDELLRQLAEQCFYNPAEHDLAAFLAVKGLAPGAITPQDLEPYYLEVVMSHR